MLGTIMSRTYRDPIHKEIFLDASDPAEALVIKLIDSQEMQRLRWIRQLGTAWFTFHGAEASRFPHSLGSMHIAKLMLENLQKDLQLDEEKYSLYKILVLSAALLHDIGHGPFSHSSEAINEIKHEVWTQKLIRDPQSQVNNILETQQKGLADQVCQVLSKTYPVKFLCSIVNSQIDCDRFDYLIRDSYYTGTAYGNFDLERVIANIKVDQENDCLVVGGEKGMLAVEDYLYARYSMYLQVYQHKNCLASDALLHKLFQRVKLLIRNKRISFIETPLLKWAHKPDSLTVQEFISIDDTTFIHHIKHWCEEKDVVLKDLSKRFLARNLFKAERIAKDSDHEQLYKERAEILLKSNLDPDFYLDIVSIAANPYSFYNPDDSSKAILVKQENTLKEISTVSHVVKSLVQNDFESSWVIFAKTGSNNKKLVSSFS